MQWTNRGGGRLGRPPVAGVDAPGPQRTRPQFVPSVVMAPWGSFERVCMSRDGGPFDGPPSATPNVQPPGVTADDVPTALAR